MPIEQSELTEEQAEQVDRDYKPKYTLYATTQNGNGMVSPIGEYESVEDIQIRVGMFAKDVVITIERE